MAQTPDDPEAEMRALAARPPANNLCHGFWRAGAVLRFAERREVDTKRIHQLRCEEGLHVRVHSPRKSAGVSLGGCGCAEGVVSNRLSDSTVPSAAGSRDRLDDRRAHPRETLLNSGERSITGEAHVEKLKMVFAPVGCASRVSRMENGPEMVHKRCSGSAKAETGSCPPPGCPCDDGYIESFNSRLRKECLNRNHWITLIEASVVIGDFKHDHDRQHHHSASGYRTPAEYASARRCTHTPVSRNTS